MCVSAMWRVFSDGLVELKGVGSVIFVIMSSDRCRVDLKVSVCYKSSWNHVTTYK